MPPPKKKAKSSYQTEKAPSVLLSDFRTAWPLQTGDETAVIKVKNEEFSVHKAVLVQHSDYFRVSTKTWYDESGGEIGFDNIDPKYFALFLGVLYSYSSIVPHTAPAPAANPEAQSQRTPLRDYVEVYKLCDRFICPTIGAYMLCCIHTLVSDRHRALFRSALDKAQQLWCTTDFADAFEALEHNHAEQKKLGNLMIEYFCEGVFYRSWEASAKEMENRPAFVLQVSRYFASKLALLLEQRTKLKRKELKMPTVGEWIV
ncbi:BTB/POZ-like protein [Cordyceps fumosorosea ARSEF 2679]|uniref:BTB/POZ-like protein n=1 Tax=Cordyceps fumosorosea (strain ARSEF 2679) TaxID=1081104 RepID=A0A167LG44_CORFA|nr:BTB/POZ-like protein [Cordyceps fumosorosea ARSEF 2679]OAA53049.1 BTB/POZ-like protein [Cordyceps fumosorosea ARSEF 2679]